MSNLFLHSVNFLLIKTSPPSSKHYFPMLLPLALTKMKNCQQLWFKASLESAPLLKTPIISHYNTEVVYYKILHLHHWSHLGLAPIKQKAAMATVFLLNPQITVTNPKQGQQTSMPKKHHYNITPISIARKTGQRGRKKVNAYKLIQTTFFNSACNLFTISCQYWFSIKHKL